MPNQIPSGWAGDPTLQTLMGTPTSEVPIKSVVTIPNNPQKYAVVTDSRGGYKVYQGGTGFDQTIDSNGTTLIFSADPSGAITNGPGWDNQNIKNNLGGNAGLGQLKDVTQKQLSQTFSTYLTPEEKNNLQNSSLKSSIKNTQPAPTDTETSNNPQIEGNQEENLYVNGVNNLEDLSEEFDDNDFTSWEKLKLLKYPLNIDSSSQDRIVITQYQYTSSINIGGDGETAGFREESKRFEKSKGSVILPIPNEISENNQVGWGEDSLSNVAAGLMPGLIRAGFGIGEGNMGEIQGGGQQILNFLGGNTALSNRAKQYLATNAAASLVKKLGVNVNPESYITRATGAAVNPNLELLFNGPKLRSFAFQFKMTPRDATEAKNIRAIIKFFKKGMSPRKAKDSEFSFFLGTPNVFKIEFKSGNSKLNSIGKIKTCAMVSFNVNYTPDGFYAAYDDAEAGGSQPIAVSIQMGFTELTPLFSDEYNDDPNDIGPNQETKYYPID